MKKYLFGLGAMVVGAGLMFVLIHGEVSADSKPESFVCSDMGKSMPYYPFHCRAGNLSCGVSDEGISCVKTGFFK